MRPGMLCPQDTVYGAIMKYKMPVDWFIIIDGDSAKIFYAEGLGTYPATAVLIYEYMRIDAYWSPEALRWMPARQPVFGIREENELLIIALDKTGDLVRWRKLFVSFRQGGEEFGGYPSSLTAVFGGHVEEIISIAPHTDLPVLATLDRAGMVRIWNLSMSVRGDPKAVDSVRHWGVLEESYFSSIKWTNKFAILVAGTKMGDVQIYKWQSETSGKLKLPSIHWEAQLSMCET